MTHPIGRVVGFLFRPLQFVVYALSGIVPRDPKIWAFGTWGGMRFADNAAALFTFMADHPEHHDIRTVWITRRRSVRDRLRRSGQRAHLSWSPTGIWWGLRAGAYIYDSTPRDLNFWLSRRSQLVLLRHGIGMKKVERAIDSTSHRLYKLFHGRPWERVLWRLALPWHVPAPDLSIACSPTHAAQAVEFYGVDPAHVHVTGFPRHDRLSQSGPPTRTALPTIGRPVPTDRPVFLYLPTFREGFGAQSFDWAAMQEAATAADVTIAVKLHVVDAERGVRALTDIDRLSHLRLIDPSVDPIDVYPNADGLITDYSSVAYDLLLLDRPVIHFVPDLDRFIADRPLLAPFEDLAIGPICRRVDELATALDDVSGSGQVDSAARRAELRRLFYTYDPGGASERVVAVIRHSLGANAPSID